MFRRTDIAFEAEGGVTLRGWLYIPTGGTAPSPAITMAHGYAGVKEHGLEPFAEKFASNGFVVLLHDHRNFGASEGTPRQDIDPWSQIADWRRAISFLEDQDAVDAKRIGLWGTSYSGGHALVLGATERRLRAVVAQVPTISGFEQGLRRIPPDAVAAIEEAFTADERAQARGEPPRRQAIVSADPAVPASYRTKEAIEFYLQPVPDGAWENNVTVRSTRAARMYEPGTWIARVSPTPLLMIVALQDTITLTDLELAAYERAVEPKRLVTIPGGHFDTYITRFDQSSTAALDWFKEHLS
ncbi:MULTISPECIES: alpha/beta hydrolase [Pseudomonas]|uniref:alpha/beta hydrolase n=1 Tax=Pseudomonas TaxID=286 RepID=UPI000B34EAA3|nr:MULTISPECIES: alpha/beta hydrolase [Pseudomonas]PMY53110.1 alpha/beta hydrolase [Pseudomonas sp. FW305-53]PMY86559.1 alpha/beta hydrolase [Pseudomonas sp. FW303-C2]PMY90526.1 alpha/beta hydrolase [Pseudomonas sp. FW305-62]PNA42751.1 alpha/beta hydrolase [Pseudomonas sp. FW306-2-2C-A10BC]PNA85635.1 alpha/beta hydrolase [Pseudomonas sp. MPR-R3B]